MARSSYLDLTKLVVPPPFSTSATDACEFITTSLSSSLVVEENHGSNNRMMGGGAVYDPDESSERTGCTGRKEVDAAFKTLSPLNLAGYDLTPIPVLRSESVCSNSLNGPSSTNDTASTVMKDTGTATVISTTVGFKTASAAVLHQAMEEKDGSLGDGSTGIHFTAFGFGDIPQPPSLVSSSAPPAPPPFLKFSATSAVAPTTASSASSDRVAANLAPSTTGSMLFSLNDNLNTMSLKSPFNSTNNMVPIVSSNSFLSQQHPQPTFPPGTPALLPLPTTNTFTVPAAPYSTLSSTNIPSPPKSQHPVKKRLERNRESAKLSRRRRKLYLQELEDKVLNLSSSMDSGRRQHVAQAISALKQLRNLCLASADRELFCSVAVGACDPAGTDVATPGGAKATANATTTISAASAYFHTLQHHTFQLQNHLSRVWSTELQIVFNFQYHQLKSLISVTPYSKLILWLTLQNEAFFRGGRSSADRLSAARIGEKLLLSGSECVPPCDGLWPLLCNEIALSYEQEEKARTYQRNLLLNKFSWVDTRHACYAMDTCLTSLYECFKRLSNQVSKREEAILNILNVEQRVRFLAWSQRRATSLANVASKISKNRTSGSYKRSNSHVTVTVSVSPHHKVLNLYLLAQKLQEVLRMLPQVNIPPLAPYDIMKKMSRRPMYEPLGVATVTTNSVNGDQTVMQKKNSDATCGDSGLKISPCTSKSKLDESSDVVIDGPHHKAQVTPAAAWSAAFPLIAQVFGPIGVPFQQQPIAGFCLQRKSSTSSTSINSSVTVKNNYPIKSNPTLLMANSDHAVLSPLTPHTIASAPQSNPCFNGQEVAPVMSNTLSFSLTAPHHQPPKGEASSKDPLSVITVVHKRENSLLKSSFTSAAGGHAPDGSLLACPLPLPAAAAFTGHVRDVSLLNCPLPQDMFLDMFPGHFRTESKGQSQADQYLLQLAEDDGWAIGGFDIEMGDSP